MKSFIQQHQRHITHTLSGFDRLRLRGSFSLFTSGGGLHTYLDGLGLRFGGAAGHFQEITKAIKSNTASIAAKTERPYHYLQSPSLSKEKIAREICRRDRITDGLICALGCVEPCWAYKFQRKSDGVIEWKPTRRQCLHQYFYLQHREFGFCHLRVATWCPFTVTVNINGREWLARQMDAAGIGYSMRGNCFLSISDPARAQRLSYSQVRRNWVLLLNQLCRTYHPAWEMIRLNGLPLEYYWSIMESEWATDIVFRSRRSLDKIYEPLIRYGLLHFDSPSVMRFLGGRSVTRQGQVHGNFQQEVFSDCKRRPEGLRIRHWAGSNSIKMYNKEHRVLRVETTINDPSLFKTLRPKTTDPDGPEHLLPVPKGVTAAKHRTKVSQQCNARYLDALATVAVPGPCLKEIFAPIAMRTSLAGRPARGLRLFDQGDLRLLEAISQGEHSLHGFRNRDIRRQLHRGVLDAAENRRLANKVTRQLGMLRAHQLIQKIPGTHRYQLTPRGQRVTAALTVASSASFDQLLAAAA